MGIFVKELWAFGSKETAIFVDLLPFCAVASVKSPLNQGALYSTVDWEGFIEMTEQEARARLIAGLSEIYGIQDGIRMAGTVVHGIMNDFKGMVEDKENRVQEEYRF